MFTRVDGLTMGRLVKVRGQLWLHCGCRKQGGRFFDRSWCRSASGEYAYAARPTLLPTHRLVNRRRQRQQEQQQEGDHLPLPLPLPTLPTPFVPLLPAECLAASRNRRQRQGR